MSDNLNHILARVKPKAARAAARAYASRCSWVHVDDLESDAWEGILRSNFDPARAPVLSEHKRKTLSADEQLAEQGYLFYRRVGIRWLSSKVARAKSPVSIGDDHARHKLHGHVALSFDDIAQQVEQQHPQLGGARHLFETAPGISDYETAQLRQQVAIRLAELMGENREGEIATAFLLRTDDSVTAADVAAMYGVTRKQVYQVAEKAKNRVAMDRTMLRLYEGFTEA